MNTVMTLDYKRISINVSYWMYKERDIIVLGGYCLLKRILRCQVVF